ncbi:MAG TPA: 5-oxoprolinase subunit PxpA [Candidatus Acidoferrum sp.]|nr:5-oxoprolinase subunit PxpA [Candidatus Acidoferrum sp.]
MTRIDLNCDMGELTEAIADGTQESLMPWLTSVNVACGGHAGDAQTMEATIRQAQKHHLAIGAHPGYADRENFGRLELKLSGEQIADSVFQQVSALSEVASRLNATIRHVKPHGALYNQAVHNREIAQAIADGVARWNNQVVLVVLAGSPMLDVFREAGFAVAAEAFADRRYEPDGTLRPRKFRDALLHDPAEAAKQAVSIATRGKLIAQNGSEISVVAQTLCIHGDTPGAGKIAAAVAEALRAAFVSVQPL